MSTERTGLLVAAQALAAELARDPAPAGRLVPEMDMLIGGA